MKKTTNKSIKSIKRTITGLVTAAIMSVACVSSFAATDAISIGTYFQDNVINGSVDLNTLVDAGNSNNNVLFQHQNIFNQNVINGDVNLNTVANLRGDNVAWSDITSVTSTAINGGVNENLYGTVQATGDFQALINQIYAGNMINGDVGIGNFIQQK